MAEEPSELREQIEHRRESIATTVDQIENRVSPSSIAARRTAGLRQRLSSMADSVFGADEPDNSDYLNGPHGYSSNDQSLIDRAKDATPSLDTAPSELRQRTRGNPAAVGFISFGAGMLLGSVLPESSKEKDLARNVQPQLQDVASEAASAGKGVLEDLREPAKQAAQSVKDSAASATDDVKANAKSAAKDIKDQAKP